MGEKCIHVRITWSPCCTAGKKKCLASNCRRCFSSCWMPTPHFLSLPISLGTSFISANSLYTHHCSLQTESLLSVINIFWSLPVLKKKIKPLLSCPLWCSYSFLSCRILESYLDSAEPFLFWFNWFSPILHFSFTCRDLHPPPTSNIYTFIKRQDFYEVFLYLLSALCDPFPLSIYPFVKDGPTSK